MSRSTIRRWRPYQQRSAFIVVLLLLTLLLAGALAYQALDAARSHRETAEAVLDDYASFAAHAFASRAAQNVPLYGTFQPMRPFYSLEMTAPDASLPSPRAMLASDVGWERRAAKMVRSFFRLNLRDGRLQTRGAESPPSVRDWIKDTLPRHIDAVYEPALAYPLVIGRVEGKPRAIVYGVASDSDGTSIAAYGYEADVGSIDSLLSTMVAMGPLLPPALTEGVVYDSLVAATVTDALGNEFYRTESQYPLTYSASDTLGVRVGDMRVTVALRPDVAQQLIIGGLPSSRLPLLLGLLALTVGLVVAALLQLKREYELARLRTEFISSVSHELRTPLAQLRMFAETLLLGRVRSKDERNRSLEIIDQEARRLTHLVENVLHFSRSERKVNRITPEPTEVTPLVRELIEAFTPLAATSNVHLVAQFEENVVATVDRSGVRQMLLNLLDNAVKYGPSGQTVTVGVGLAEEHHLRVWVDDQGPGIGPKDRERVFERFSRLARERGSAVAGTGIGLAVVRDLALLHGGRTWVEDAPSPGARFVIELPGARRVSGEYAAARTVDRPVAAGPQPHVSQSGAPV